MQAPRRFRLRLRHASLLAFLLVSLPRTLWAQLDAFPESPLPPPPIPQPAPLPVDPPPLPPAADLRLPPTFASPPTTPPPGDPSPPYQATVRARRPSPAWTQDRSFTSTRFWLLDPGNYEAQVWFRTRAFPELGGVRAAPEFLFQAEVEIGVVPHLQIDLYENLNFNVGEDGARSLQQEGVQIEARVAIPNYYGEMFGNPVLYFEFHPRHNDPDRGEFRLLLGGAPTRWLYLALNPYVEANLQPTDILAATVDGTGQAVVTKTSKYIADAEFGTTVALGFRIHERFRVSAEVKIGADMLGDAENKFHFVWFAGPGFILKPLPPRYSKYLKIMGTCLFAMPGTELAAGAQQIEPLLIIGSQF